jgi:hypothetical protein
VAVVSLDHGWQEFLDGEPVRDGVDLECFADLGFGLVENGLAAGDSGIVDEDGWRAMLFSDGVAYFFELRG